MQTFLDIAAESMDKINIFQSALACLRDLSMARLAVPAADCRFSWFSCFTVELVKGTCSYRWHPGSPPRPFLWWLQTAGSCCCPVSLDQDRVYRYDPLADCPLVTFEEQISAVALIKLSSNAPTGTTSVW